MARGRKSYTLEEESELTNTKIENFEKELKNLKSRKKELEKLMIEQEMSELYDAIKQSGNTVADIIQMIK